MHTHPRTHAELEGLTVRLLGAWLVHKARRQARASGTYRAALNLRKAGVPLELALGALRGGYER